MRDSRGRFIKGHSLGKRFTVGFTPWNKGTKGATVAWNKGRKTGKKAHNNVQVSRTCEICKITFSLSPALCKNNRGRYCSRKCLAVWRKQFTGKLHSRWIEDRTKLKVYGDENKDRRSSAYGTWRKEVWLRDDFKCKLANPDCKGRLEAHHILGYHEYPELRYKISNGITLCHAHHPRKRAEEKRLAPIFMELVSVSKDIF